MDTITNNQNSSMPNLSLIVETINKNNIIISSILLLTGVLFTFHSFIFPTGKTVEILLVIIGVILIIIGAVLLLFKSKQKVYEKTGSAIQSKVLYLPREELGFAKSLLDSAKFENEKAFTVVDSSNLYLEIQVSKDRCFAAAQLFEFIPYDFQPATQVYYFTDRKALKFCEYLERCPKK